MEVVVGFLVALVAICLIGYLVSYNRLVSDRQQVSDAWATIDAELARRRTLVPMLVHAVEDAATHERRLLDRLVAAERAATAAADTAAARSAPEHELAAAARAVVALREQYPALNSQQNFLRLQHDLAITEDRVGAARRFYNVQVAQLNRRVQAFPSNLVATRHGFVPAAYFDPD